MTTKSLFALMIAASLPLFGGCVDNGNGNDDTAGGSDDTGTDGWAATVRAILPDGLANAEVKVDGRIADCDGLSCVWTADEAGTYEVTATADLLYFATLTATVENDGDEVSVTWEAGGCGDPDWDIADGRCDTWQDSQFGCDLNGFWKGVEDGDVHDIRGDVEMATTDVDGDGVPEASAIGGYDSDDLTAFIQGQGNNIAGTVMTSLVPPGGSSEFWTNAQMVTDVTTNAPGGCDSGLIRVVYDSIEFHMELLQE